MCAADTDCEVQPHPCEHKTLEMVRELAGNAPCWRGSRENDGVLAALCPFSRFVHKVWGQSLRAQPGWGWRSPRPSAHKLQGEQMSEEALEGARDRVPRVQGGSQLLSVRVSSTHCPGAQVPCGSITAILEAGK